MKRSPATLRRPAILDVEAWAELGEDESGELVDGVLEDEEMPTVMHEVVVRWLLILLHAWAARRSGFAIASEAKLAIGPRRGRKPDVSVFLPPHLPRPEDTLIRAAPHVVVEVISPRPRDARRDRVEKHHDYAKAGARFYVLLDPQIQSFEVSALDDKTGRYATVVARANGKVRVPGMPGLVVDLDSLWRELAALADAPRKR